MSGRIPCEIDGDTFSVSLAMPVIRGSHAQPLYGAKLGSGAFNTTDIRFKNVRYPGSGDGPLSRHHSSLRVQAPEQMPQDRCCHDGLLNSTEKTQSATWHGHATPSVRNASEIGLPRIPIVCSDGAIGEQNPGRLPIRPSRRL
jgi:hypothetical protein